MFRYIVQPNDTIYGIRKKIRMIYAEVLLLNQSMLDYNSITKEVAISIQEVTLTVSEKLGIIESNAEAIIDNINKNDWENVYNNLSIIKNTYNDLRTTLNADSVPINFIYNIDRTITNLENQTALKKEYESKIEANAITLYISYVLFHYMQEMQSGVKRLEYLGRSIIINAQNNNWESAYDNWDYVNVNWNILKNKFPIGSENEVNEFSQIVSSLENLIESNDFEGTIEKATAMLSMLNNFEIKYNL